MPPLRRGLLCAAVAGILTAVPFFPFGASFLVGASLVPLLIATATATVRRGALYGFVAGFVGCGIAFHWILPLGSRPRAVPRRQTGVCPDNRDLRKVPVHRFRNHPGAHLSRSFLRQSFH